MHRHILAALAVALAGGSAQAAHPRPEDAPRPWVSLDLRTAYGIPMGKFADGQDDTYLQNVYSAMVPLHVGLGVHVLPDLAVGGYAEWHFAQMNGLACERVGCDGGNTRLGLSVQYLFPSHTVRPWIELTAGWEKLSYTVMSAGLTATYTGFDAGVGFGGDYALGKGLWVGPLVGMSLGSYSHLEVDAGGRVGQEALPRQAVHGFLNLGVRGRFQL